MSHYPSSAELAAFRRSIRPTMPIPLSMTTWAPTSGRDAAWPHELRDGIGQHGNGEGRNGCVNRATVNLPLARREASAMRSRAFDAFPGNAYGYWHAHNVAAFDHERALGIPAYV